MAMTGHLALPNASEISSFVSTPSVDHARSKASVTLAAATMPAMAAAFHSSTSKTAPPATAARAEEPNTAMIRRMRVLSVCIIRPSLRVK